MKLSARFTEYGLVGAFFLITLFVIVGTSPQSFLESGALVSVKRSWSLLWENLGKIQGKSTGEVDFKEAIAAALGVVAVFVTGLLLDLLSIMFLYGEMIVFSR